jgi:glycosyltransferase involved in cell wall biosynthesis
MARLCVCIPTWNGARYLARTLRSVLTQQGVDLRVVVGDDASEDNTLEVARSFDDRRLSVQAFPDHAGLVGNWNRVLGMADGDYVALVGQDDEVASNWAARLMGLLRAYPQADLAFGRRHFVFDDEESRQALGNFFERSYPTVLAPFYARVGQLIPPKVMLREAYRYRFEFNLIGEPTFVMVRRNSPAVGKGFDPLMTQMIDWEFFTRFFADRPILHCPEVLGTYHIHKRASSMKNASPSRHHREYDYLLGVVLQRFGPSLGLWRSRQLRRRRRRIRAIGPIDADREQAITS